MTATGRRPGSPDTRGEVLAAARHRFAHDGYAGATIRSIAADAGVDPALVHHYFGTKAALFREAVAFPVDVDALVGALARAPEEQRATALARRFLEVWEDPATRPQMLSIVRSAMTYDEAAALLRTFVGHALLDPIARHLGVRDAHVRVPLAAAQLIGVVLLRHVVRLEPIASMPTDELVQRLAPALDLHLFGAPRLDA